LHIREVRVMALTTAEETFEASCDVILRWWLPFGDVVKLRKNNVAWQPPPLKVRNAKEYQEINRESSDISYFTKPVHHFFITIIVMITTQASSIFMPTCHLVRWRFRV
jgi:hypothetical protein